MNNPTHTSRTSAVVLLLTLCLLCAILPVQASPAVAPQGEFSLIDPVTGVRIYAYPAPGDEQNTRYFFLPAALPPQALRISLPAGQTAALDGQPLRDGDSAAALSPDAPHTLLIGEATCEVVVMQSRNLPAFFLSTDSGDAEYIHAALGNQEAGRLLCYLPGGDVSFSGPLEYLRMRGNISTNHEKRSYQFKLIKKTPRSRFRYIQ